MHHICVHIENDTESSDSGSSDGIGGDMSNGDIIMRRWLDLAEPGTDVEDNPLTSMQNACTSMKAAMDEFGSMRALLKSVMSQSGGFAGQIVVETETERDDISEIMIDKIGQLDACSNMFLSSAQSLREETAKSSRYFRGLETLSRKVPLCLAVDKRGDTEVRIATPRITETVIIVDGNKEDDSIVWRLSDESRFSLNGRSFALDGPGFWSCLLEFMCHALFHEIKSSMKDVTHYSADENSRSVHVDVGNRETQLFELAGIREPGPVPVWIPRLVALTQRHSAQIAMRFHRAVLFRNAREIVAKIVNDRFLMHDFCRVIRRYGPWKSVIQVSTPCLSIPIIAIIDDTRVLSCEIPDEMRLVEHMTDWPGIRPALEKSYNSMFAATFLAMAERVTQSLGYVFKNKTLYGTATTDSRKVRFELDQGRVKVIMISPTSIKTFWHLIPGSDYVTRMYASLFQDLNDVALKE